MILKSNQLAQVLGQLGSKKSALGNLELLRRKGQFARVVARTFKT